jgi:hypothetical protein
MRPLRRGLRQVQYRPDLIDGCLTGTGLTLTTPPLQPQYLTRFGHQRPLAMKMGLGSCPRLACPEPSACQW